MDTLRGLGELGLGSRLKRLSDHMMKEIQLVYDHFQIDFDPYLFPILKILQHQDGMTNSAIRERLNYTQPAITQAINKLISKELVTILPHKVDKRKKVIVLSKHGQDLIARIQPLWERMEAVVKRYTHFNSNSLIEHINKLEDQLATQSLSQMIIQDTKTTSANSIQIVNYQKNYASYFYDLNIEWLQTFFYVEAYDEEVLSQPEVYILNKGGHIFFAKLKDTIVGTVALMPTETSGIYELTKMAVSPEYRGYKIGQQLMQHCIDFAKTQQLKGLMLYSNTKLENAIYIYRKYGFVEIPMEANSPYMRGNIKMELTLKSL
jgi:DNA-binding MarR family transcriptional regulator/N-acetylglutamate synthase-like GNAT family acetyltransferase